MLHNFTVFELSQFRTCTPNSTTLGGVSRCDIIYLGELPRLGHSKFIPSP